jgi:hypothetical protein
LLTDFDAVERLQGELASETPGQRAAAAPATNAGK